MKTTGFFRAGLAAAGILAAAAAIVAAGAPAVGSTAPGFTLTSDAGRSVSLSDYKGTWVVLYFYPKDFTGG
jgi:peroxiredoxin Q/BCP